MISEGRRIIHKHTRWEKLILNDAFERTGLRITNSFFKKIRGDANKSIEAIDRSTGLIQGEKIPEISKHRYFGEMLSVLKEASLQTSNKLLSKISQFQGRLSAFEDQEQLLKIFSILIQERKYLLKNIMQLAYPYFPDTFTFSWIKDWKKEKDRVDYLSVGEDNLLWGEHLRSELGLHPKKTIKSDGYRRNNLSNDPQYVYQRSFSEDPNDVFAEQKIEYFYNKLPLLTVSKKYYTYDDPRYSESEWSEIKIVARAKDTRNAYLLVSFTPEGEIKKELIHEDKVFDGNNFKIHQVLSSLGNIISEGDLKKINVEKLWQLAKIYSDKGSPLDNNFYEAIVGQSEAVEEIQPLTFKPEIVKKEMIGKSFEGLINRDTHPKINTKYLLSTDGNLLELPEIPLSRNTIDKYMFQSTTTLLPLKRDDIRFQPGLFESISFIGPQNNFRMRVGVLRSDDGKTEGMIEINVLSARSDKSDATISFFEDGTIQVEDFDCADWQILERQKEEMANDYWRLPPFENVPNEVNFQETWIRFMDAVKKGDAPANTLDLIVPNKTK